MLKSSKVFLRTFGSSHRKMTKTAIIGNNPKVPELIEKYKLTKYMIPVYFKNEGEMLRPGDCDSALIVNSNPKQMEDFLGVQKKIKWIHSTMAGVDWVIGNRLKNSNITLTNAKGAFSESLAEHVLFSILYFTKRTPYFLETRARHEWAPVDVDSARNLKVGIIGYGNIGYNIAELLKRSIESKIYACCNEMSEMKKKYLRVCDKVYTADDYQKVLTKSDFVVGTLPKTPKTVNYFNMEKFKMMKPSAVFMNIGRGVTMVEEDLVQALKEGVITGASLDVFPQEPLPATSKLYDMKNVLMTYHCTDRTPDYWERTMSVFRKELKNYIKGKAPENLIDKSKAY